MFTPASLTMQKSLTKWITTIYGKLLKEMGISDCLNCFLRNLCVGQEATIRTGHRTTDWFQIGKGIHRGCICHAAYLTYMQSTSCEMLELGEAQAGIKIAGRNINNLRQTDDTTLMAESEEELKILLMKLKEETKKLA